MLNRRSFLRSAAIAATLPLFSSCRSRRDAFQVILLAHSIPPQLLREFRASLTEEAALNFTAEEQLKDLFEFLKTWKEGDREQESESNWFDKLPFRQKQVPTAADLIALGHYWLPDAVEQQLIQPLDLERLAGWKKLPDLMQKLATREGKVWGAPYRWGTTAIAYNRDKFKSLGWTPADWSDLWKPELRDRIAIIDQPREVIGLTLKALGYSYNELNLGSIPKLKTSLIGLHQQIKFYSSTAYLQPLILEDVWVAVGWSADILPVLKQYPDLEAVVPRSGTALWADLWVKPAKKTDGEATQSLSDRWIDFCWQEKAAQQISLFTPGTSPILLTLDRASVAQSLQENALVLPSAEIFQQSEFILPLPAASQQQYEALWKEIRRPPAKKK